MCDPWFQAVLAVIMFANAPSKWQIFWETSFFPLFQVQYTYTHTVSSDSPSPLSDNSFHSIPIQDLTWSLCLVQNGWYNRQDEQKCRRQTKNPDIDSASTDFQQEGADAAPTNAGDPAALPHPCLWGCPRQPAPSIGGWGKVLWQPKVLQSNKHMFHVSKITSSFWFLKFELRNSAVTIKVTCIFSFNAPICWCLCDRRWWDRWDQWKGESPASQRKAIRSTPWERWTCNERPMILSKSCYCTPPHFKDLRGKNANHTICVVYIMICMEMPWRILQCAFKINWGECRPGPWAQPVADAQVLLAKRSQGLDKRNSMRSRMARKRTELQLRMVESLTTEDHSQSSFTHLIICLTLVVTRFVLLTSFYFLLVSHFTHLILPSTFCLPHFNICQSHHFLTLFYFPHFAHLFLVISFFAFFTAWSFFWLRLIHHRRPRPIRPGEQKLWLRTRRFYNCLIYWPLILSFYPHIYQLWVESPKCIYWFPTDLSGRCSVLPRESCHMAWPPAAVTKGINPIATGQAFEGEGDATWIAGRCW